MATAKVANLSTLIRHETMPQCDPQGNKCDNNCDSYDYPGHVSKLLDAVTLEDTKALIASEDPHKVIYIAGHLVHKHGLSCELNSDIIE